MLEQSVPGRRSTGGCVFFSLVLLIAWFAPACVARTVRRRTLTTVGAITRLSSTEAGSGYRVRLRGQITYIDSEWAMMFLRTGTGVVFVRLPPNSSDLRAGDVVVVQGVTEAGLAGSYIERSRWRLLSHRPMPKPVTATLASLSKGSDESEYVSTEGVLRQGPSLWGHTHLLLVDGRASIPMVIPGGVNTKPLRYVGNVVTVRGVAGAQTNAKGARIGTVLYLQSVKAIQPVSAQWRNWLDAAVVSIQSLRSMDVRQRFLPAVHLRGRVLWRSADKFVLEDRSGTILVQTPSTASFRVGERLDVVGFPAVVKGMDRLRDADIRKLGSTAPRRERPRQWTLAEALREGSDGDVVTLSGTLIAESAQNGFYTFTMEDQGGRFSVLAAASQESGQPLTIRPGAKVEATGTLRLLRYRGHRPESIQLLVESPDDIVIASGRVSWAELLLLLGVCLMLGIAFWIIQMRRTLRAKTALIRAQMAQESKLEDKYRRLFERSPTAIFLWRSSGEITDCNPAFARMLGFGSAAEVVGRSYWSMLVDEVSAQFAGQLEAGTVNDRESTLRRADGRIVYLLENVTRVERDDGPHYETTALDVTQSRLDRMELQRAKMAAQREAEVDALTGLSNRRRFSELASRRLERAGEQKTRVAVLFLDLDGFKAINDTLGHLIGDMLLQQVADRLKHRLRAGDVLARLGGDEFAVLPGEAADVEDPERVATALLEALAVPFEIAGRELTIGASIGISMFPDLALDYTNLLQQADSAMYVAKQAGRNRVVRYNDAIGRSLQEKNQITAELKRAIARGEISLHYQPEFDRGSGRIVRFEALARWTSPKLGAVSPVQFIAAAEESGLIGVLGNYLLERACRAAVDWQQRSGRSIPVAVNISPLQLRAEGFVVFVRDTLQRTGLPPTSLELEMTESVLLGDFEQCRRALTQLRAWGVKLALDDFGTGYSSLSYLPELPFDRLKIARCFLEKANRGRSGETLIDAVIGIAHRLGMSVVVEGIETRKELEFIHTVGADELQGYFLGRPGRDPHAVIVEHFGESEADGTVPAGLLALHGLKIVKT